MLEFEVLDFLDDLNFDSEDKNGGEDIDNEEGEEENFLEIKEKLEEVGYEVEERGEIEID